MEDKHTDNTPQNTGNTAANSGVEEAAISTSDRLGSLTLSADADADKCCAACGKAGPDGLKRCTACKSVWYCGVNCQIDHRKTHKKECKRIKKELEAQEEQSKGEAEKEEKFSLLNPMPEEECPICMVVLPPNTRLRTYMACCSKYVCGGCIYAHQTVQVKGKVDETCPFCRHLAPATDAEVLECVMARTEIGDAYAMLQLSLYYEKGACGLPVDRAKAIELKQKSADVGCIRANQQLGDIYCLGLYGIPKNLEKARLHYEYAAKRGNPDAQINLGLIECDNGNFDIGITLFRLAAEAGKKRSLRCLEAAVKQGLISKEKAEESEKAYGAAIEAMRTEERDKRITYLKDTGKQNGSIIDLYQADD